MLQHVSCRAAEGTIHDVFRRKQADLSQRMIPLLDALDALPDLRLFAHEGHSQLLLSREDNAGRHIVSVIATEPGFFTLLAHAAQPLSFISREGDVRYAGASLDDVVCLVRNCFNAENWESTG